MQMLYQLSYAPDDRETFRSSDTDSSFGRGLRTGQMQPHASASSPSASWGRRGDRGGQPLSARFTSVETHDVRFPTSRDRDGSDAMNPDPDYSAAYVILRTDDPGGLAGHGFALRSGAATTSKSPVSPRSPRTSSAEPSPRFATTWAVSFAA
jgi:hypothetical protein